MARLLTNAEIWDAITTVGVLRDDSVDSTTVAAAAAVDQPDFEVAAAGTIAADDILRIGNEANQEVVIVEALASTTVTCVSNLAYAHAIGEPVESQVRTVVGDISDDGLDVEFQADRNQVNAATRRERLAFLIGNVNARCSFSLEGHSQENLAAALGILEANQHGAGSAADPYVMDMTPDDWAETDLLFQSWYFLGSLKNGTTVEAQFWRTQIDPNSTRNYGRGNPTLIPVAVDVGHVRYYQPAPPA